MHKARLRKTERPESGQETKMDVAEFGSGEVRWAKEIRAVGAIAGR
ncbi:MAG: hypothetical protein J5636_07850 [Clostridiales bacterium]|nr:hypothetical protein [Clostridiales bacterium]